MKKLIFSIIAVCITIASYADVTINATNFPDENFRKVVAMKDLNKDGILSTSEAGAVTIASTTQSSNTIGIFNLDITDLTGIKYFYNLEYFGEELSGGYSTEISLTKDLDLSGMTKLKYFRLENPVNSKSKFKVIVNNCTALKTFIIKRMVQPIDFDIKGCTSLEEIIYSDHQNGASLVVDLSIWVTKDECPNLKKITICNNRYLNKLAINSPTVEHLVLTGNGSYWKGSSQAITYGACANVKTVDVSDNYLDDLGVQMSNLPKLESFKCSNNNLSEIKINNCPRLLANTAPEVFLGAQRNNKTVTVTMTEAQKKVFDATNAKNKYVNIQITGGTGGSEVIDAQPPTINNKNLTLTHSEDMRSITVNWNAATDDNTAQKNIKYYVYLTNSNNKSYLDDPYANRVPPVSGETGAIINVTTIGSYTSDCYLKDVGYMGEDFKMNEKYYATVIALDEAGNYSYYNTGVITLAANNPIYAPQIYNPNIILDVTDDKRYIDVSWNAAIDNNTPQSGIKYNVFITDEANKYKLDNAVQLLGASNDQEGPLQFNTTQITYRSDAWSKDFYHFIGDFPDGTYYATVVAYDSYGYYSYYNPSKVIVTSADVNRDKNVNAADVVSVYNYIIEGDNSGVTFQRANVNGDNDVNAADIVAIYNYICNDKSE